MGVFFRKLSSNVRRIFYPSSLYVAIFATPNITFMIKPAKPLAVFLACCVPHKSCLLMLCAMSCAYSAAGNMWTDPENIYIYRLQTHEFRIRTEAAQFPEKEYINGIFVAVCPIQGVFSGNCLPCRP